MNIELLNSQQNRDLLLKAVYSMIGVSIDEEERQEKRYTEMYQDLVNLLHDVTTDFASTHEHEKKDLSTLNRKIALRMFQLHESREEKKVLDERRREEV
jgi:hypothetical protein